MTKNTCETCGNCSPESGGIHGVCSKKNALVNLKENYYGDKCWVPKPQRPVENPMLACRRITPGREMESCNIDILAMAAQDAQRNLLNTMEKHGIGTRHYLFQVEIRAIPEDAWYNQGDRPDKAMALSLDLDYREIEQLLGCVTCSDRAGEIDGIPTDGKLKKRLTRALEIMGRK
jgi:hypothetical protein